MASRSSFILVLVLALASLADAQQPNSAEATFRIDGFDDQVHPLAPLLAAPGTHTFDFQGGAYQAFALFQGPVSVGFTNIPAIGVVDLDLAAPGFAMVLDGLDPQTALDGLAVLGGTGQVFIPIAFPQGFTGAFGGMQALFADPTSASGYRLSAANVLTVVAAFSLSAISPASGSPGGGQLVSIAGSGFTPGAPVSVEFGAFPAAYASVFSSTLITATTPPNFPGTLVDVGVTHGGITRTLIDAFSYAPLSHPKVLINEIGTGSPDYVELYNPNGVAVDLSGWSLHSWYHGTTPDAGSPYVFMFGTVIPAGGLLVIQEQGTPQTPGTLPNSISTGNDFWWSGARQVEVALVDDLGLGVDYFHRRWYGMWQAPNLPFPLSWTGQINATDDFAWRHDAVDTDDVQDFTLSTAGSPGALNPGQ